MKKKIIVPFAALAVCCILGGCVSAPPPETCDLETSVQILMEKMLDNPQFTKNYNAAKTAKGALPIVCQSPIVNKTPKAEVRSMGRAADDLVRVALFDAGIFEVKDELEIVNSPPVPMAPPTSALLSIKTAPHNSITPES